MENLRIVAVLAFTTIYASQFAWNVLLKKLFTNRLQIVLGSGAARLSALLTMRCFQCFLLSSDLSSTLSCGPGWRCYPSLQTARSGWRPTSTGNRSSTCFCLLLTGHTGRKAAHVSKDTCQTASSPALRGLLKSQGDSNPKCHETIFSSNSTHLYFFYLV